MGSGGAKVCMGAVMAVWRRADKTEGGIRVEDQL
jgi:hypothetical protein